MMFGSEHKSAIAIKAGVALPLENPAGMQCVGTGLLW